MVFPRITASFISDGPTQMDHANFALRMPPEMKEAAKALSKTHFYEWGPDDKTVMAYGGGSINESLLQLMKSGMRTTLIHLDKAIAEATAEHATFQEFVAWFMQNPVAKVAAAANFADGSAARKYIEERERVVADPDYADDYDPSVGRAEAAEEFARAQRHLLSLVEAKGAMQLAL